MNIGLMQFIDYWLGIPCCFICSLWSRLQRAARPQYGIPIQKILFIELSEMGSSILAYPAMIKAREKFGAELYFLIFERNRESVDLLEVIPQSHVITIRDENLILFLISFARALLRIRSLRIDSVIDMELFSRCTALISFLSGAVRKAGYHRYTWEGLYRGSFWTHPVLYNPHIHMSENFLALVGALGQSEPALPMLKENVSADVIPLPSLQFSSEHRSSLVKLLKELSPDLKECDPLVILNPDPGLLSLRGWPLSRFSEFCRKLAAAFPRARFVVVGLKRTAGYVAEIREGLPEAAFIDFTGRTASLAELSVLLSLGAVFLTNDSGPAHLASLTPIKSFVLFGPETPKLYGPLGKNATCFHAGLACSPCYAATNHRRTVCTDNKCLQAISVDEVFNAVHATLMEWSEKQLENLS